MNKSRILLLAIVLLANSFHFSAAQADMMAADAGMPAGDIAIAGSGDAFEHHPVASKLLAAKISGVRAKVSGVREHLESIRGNGVVSMPML